MPDLRTAKLAKLAFIAVVTLVVGGCAPGATTTAGPEEPSPSEAPSAPAEAAATADTHDEDMAAVGEHTETMEHATEAFAFGEPADPADADRTVTVRATDQLRFEPATVQVHDGEIVTFEVTNVGELPHDFTLGDEATQDRHAREMAEMGTEMRHEDPNTLALAPGETASLTWRFHEGGEVLYGCHQPGHYEAGMVGTVDIAP